MSDRKQFLQAAQEGDASAVDRLLADRPELASTANENDVSVLLLALYCSQPEIADAIAAVKELLAVPELAALGRSKELARALDENPSALDRPTPDGFRPLGLASFFGRGETVELLLARGADATLAADNAMGVTPLHSAVAHRDPRVALANARRLLAGGADPDARQHGGWTALHSAAMHGNHRLVELLVEHGATRDLTNDDGTTAAALAAENGHGDLADRLSS